MDQFHKVRFKRIGSMWFCVVLSMSVLLKSDLWFCLALSGSVLCKSDLCGSVGSVFMHLCGSG